MSRCSPRLRRSRFQSSPGPKAECYVGEGFPPRRRQLVSILTRPEGRVLRETLKDFPQGWIEFQSSPGPKAECYVADDVVVIARDAVSILTRPEGRVLPRQMRLFATEQEFQSSPGPKAECYARRGRRSRRASGCFNPHPARRPSATGGQRVLERHARGVSILTRPEGRVLRARKYLRFAFRLFQSSPGPKAECYLVVVVVERIVVVVSILTRPEGRVLLYSRPQPNAIPMFQSSPGPKAECYRCARHYPAAHS